MPRFYILASTRMWERVISAENASTLMPTWMLITSPSLPIRFSFILKWVGCGSWRFFHFFLRPNLSSPPVIACIIAYINACIFACIINCSSTSIITCIIACIFTYIVISICVSIIACIFICIFALIYIFACIMDYVLKNNGTNIPS